jgi:hypothetical protein
VQSESCLTRIASPTGKSCLAGGFMHLGSTHQPNRVESDLRQTKVEFQVEEMLKVSAYFPVEGYYADNESV